MTMLSPTEDGPRDLDLVCIGPQAQKSAPAEVFVEDEHVVRVVLRPGVQVTPEVGALIRQRFLSLTAGKGAAILLEITGVEAISREALRVFSGARTVTAFATLGSTPVDRVMAHGLHGLPLPQCPSRYFSDEAAALTWLRGVIARDHRDSKPIPELDP